MWGRVHGQRTHTLYTDNGHTHGQHTHTVHGQRTHLGPPVRSAGCWQWRPKAGLNPAPPTARYGVRGVPHRWLRGGAIWWSNPNIWWWIIMWGWWLVGLMGGICRFIVRHVRTSYEQYTDGGHIYTHTVTQKHTHTLTLTHTHKHTHAHMHTYIHKHSHTHARYTDNGHTVHGQRTHGTRTTDTCTPCPRPLATSALRAGSKRLDPGSDPQVTLPQTPTPPQMN